MTRRPGASEITRLANRLHSAAIHLLRRLRTEDDPLGLTGPQLSALSVVVFRGPVSLGELARAEQVRPPTITRLVRRLEEEGYLTRERDPEDRRVVRVRPTERAVRLLEEGRARRVDALAGELGSLGREEVRTLREAVDILETLVEREFPA